MKVLFGMPDKQSWGGVSACEPLFVVALHRLGVEIAEETYVYGEKLKKISYRERVSRVMKTALRFRRIMRREPFDIVHLNTAFDMKTVLRDFVTVSLIRNSRTKIFLKLHGSEENLLLTRNPLKRKLWQNLFAKVDGIGVLSGEEQANLIDAGVDKTKIFTVKNAVRTFNDLPARRFDCQPFRLLFVSRFVPTKGLLDTVRAAAILKKKNVNFSLTCVGDGEVRHAAELLARQLGLTDCVKFTGYLSEEKVSEFYRRSDALVFPTFHAEGFPMVIFTALAHGLPIITTEIRAAGDYLNQPANCLWTAKHNPANLAEKIIELIGDENLRRQMSDNNRRLAAHFTAAKIAHEYLEIYQQIKNQTSSNAVKQIAPFRVD